LANKNIVSVNYFTLRQDLGRHFALSKWEAVMREAVCIAALVALVVAGIASSLAGIGRSNNEQRVLEATAGSRSIVGTTAIGWLVARRLRRAIALHVLVCKPYLQAVGFAP
jgi:di/tricarboxylate transporter